MNSWTIGSCSEEAWCMEITLTLPAAASSRMARGAASAGDWAWNWGAVIGVLVWRRRPPWPSVPGCNFHRCLGPLGGEQVLDQPVADKLRVQLHVHQVHVGSQRAVGLTAPRGVLGQPRQCLVVAGVED